MRRQVLDLRALPGAVSSRVHVDFIRGLLPNEVQKIGGEGALAKVSVDYWSPEQPPQGKERKVACSVLSRLPDVSSHWFSVQTGQKY